MGLPDEQNVVSKAPTRRTSTASGSFRVIKILGFAMHPKFDSSNAILS